MKKSVALLLCALLTLLCGLACAEGRVVTLPESSDSFRAELSLADGIEFENNVSQDSYSLCTVKQGNLADIHIVVAFDEMVAGQSLSDMTDEQLDELVALNQDGESMLGYEKITAENGQPYLCVAVMEGGVFNYYMTVYDGHIISLTQYRNEFEPLTEEDCVFMLQTLAGLQLIPES